MSPVTKSENGDTKTPASIVSPNYQRAKQLLNALTQNARTTIIFPVRLRKECSSVLITYISTMTWKIKRKKFLFLSSALAIIRDSLLLIERISYMRIKNFIRRKEE